MEDDGPPGVPEWVVTYGDMMSLLLTFFIMLVSLSEIVAEQKYRDVLTALDERLGFTTSPVTPPGKDYQKNSQLENPNERSGSQSDLDQGRGGLKTKSVEGDDRRIKVTDEGKPQQVGSYLTFIPGTTSLSGDSEDALRHIASELRGKPNKIEIRSHVAGRAGTAEDQASTVDTIQQSYEQGHTVFRLLENWGINPERVRITAAGTAMAGDVATDEDVPLERIEVFITDVFSTEYVGRRTQ